MQTIVIIFNVTLACCCLAVARQIWRFRLSLRRSTRSLLLAEMVAHEVLKDAPAQIAQGQFTAKQWKQFLAQLEPAMQRGQAILTWVQWGQMLGMFVLRRGWKVHYSRARQR